MTGYSISLHSAGWLNSRELTFFCLSCVKLLHKWFCGREYIASKCSRTTLGQAPSSPVSCSPDPQCSGKERRKLGEYRVNFPWGHSPWSQKTSNLRLPERGMHPRLSDWPVPHEFPFLKSFSAFGFPCILFTLYITFLTLQPPVMALLGHHFSEWNISSNWSSALVKVFLDISARSLENIAVCNVNVILNQIDPNNFVLVIWLHTESKTDRQAAVKSCVIKL